MGPAEASASRLVWPRAVRPRTARLHHEWHVLACHVMTCCGMRRFRVDQGGDATNPGRCRNVESAARRPDAVVASRRAAGTAAKYLATHAARAVGDARHGSLREAGICQ